jgi:type IV pilus assembly protein PilC
MPVYRYKVRNRKGELIEGEIEAENYRKAIEGLRAKDLYIVEVREPGKGLRREIALRDLLASRPNLKDVALFARQLATMLSAGITLLQALAIQEAQTQKPSFAKVIKSIRQAIEEGSAFHAALRKYSEVFPKLVVNLVRSGEASGGMEVILDRIATYLEKELAIRGKVRSAMTYPTLVFTFAILVSYFLLAFVVPQFASILTDIGGELPLVTRFLIFISGLLRNGFPFLVVILVGGFFAYRYFLRRIPAFKARVDWIKLKGPIFGPLISKNILASLLRTLALLQRSGVPILEALELARESVDNTHIQRAMDTARNFVEEGRPLSEALRRHGELFPPMVVSMVSIGEESGAADIMMEKVAQHYEREVDDAISSLSSIIEPVLIIFLGGLVGFIVIALFMPIIQIIQTISNQ